MERYEIKHPYLGYELKDGFLEIEIKSNRLIYSEIGKTHMGLQCESDGNEEEIMNLCKQVADLIRKIDKLNN